MIYFGFSVVGCVSVWSGRWWEVGKSQAGEMTSCTHVTTYHVIKSVTKIKSMIPTSVSMFTIYQRTVGQIQHFDNASCHAT